MPRRCVAAPARGAPRGVPGGAIGRLRLPAGALRGLGGAAGLLGAAQMAVHSPLQPWPRPGLLLAAPEGGEAIAEQIAARLEIDRQDVEPAVGGAVLRLRREPRIQIGRVAGLVPDSLGIGSLQLLEMPAHPGQHHVAVVDLAEDVLEVARPAAGGVGGTAEGEACHL